MYLTILGTAPDIYLGWYLTFLGMLSGYDVFLAYFLSLNLLVRPLRPSIVLAFTCKHERTFVQQLNALESIALLEFNIARTILTTFEAQVLMACNTLHAAMSVASFPSFPRFCH